MISTRRLYLTAAAVGVVVAAGCGVGAGVRSTFGGRAAVDEPQYLLTALSLAEGGDLDISDELAARRWRAFHDAPLPEQTRELGDGRRVSPHDPLLSLLLAGPVAVGGLAGAKVFLAVIAGLTAGLLVVAAVRRLDVPLPVATGGALVLCLSPPLAVYGTQVYPELPAGSVTLGAVALLLGPVRTRTAVVIASAVTALPWLSVKYVPVAAALAGVLLVRLVRSGRARTAVITAAGLTVMAVSNLLLHRLWYGGWTAYAAGDHFVNSGEFGVVGFRPNYVGRSTRLVGLLADREFGLVAWQPAWLLVVPALTWFAARRHRVRSAVAVPVLAGWATATWIALTMHGYWWPGRQLVVVLPAAALAVLAWAGAARARAWTLLTSGAVGVVAYAWLLVDGRAGRLTWVSGFADVGNPLYRVVRSALPDYRDLGTRTWLLHVAWAIVLVALVLTTWRRTGPSTSVNDPATREVVHT